MFEEDNDYLELKLANIAISAFIIFMVGVLAGIGWTRYQISKVEPPCPIEQSK